MLLHVLIGLIFIIVLFFLFTLVGKIVCVVLKDDDIKNNFLGYFGIGFVTTCLLVIILGFCYLFGDIFLYNFPQFNPNQ